MVKLMICTLGAAALALSVLQLRQQRMELGREANELHEQIRDQQGRLWNQQMQIAMFTAPNAIRQTVNTHDLNLVPQLPLPPSVVKRNWMDVETPANVVPVKPKKKSTKPKR